MSSAKISPSQNNPSKPIPILDIIHRLRDLLDLLSEAKNKSKTSQVEGDGKKDEDHPRTDGDKRKETEIDKRKETEIDERKKSEMDLRNQLDKACNELSYMITEFEKLKRFEAEISLPLDTLEDNVKDIVTDMDQAASTLSTKQLIERNLKVLRSNITKVKIQIPLQHQFSSTGSEASRYLQTTVASKEGGFLPDPYEAKEIFDSGSFVKEFQNHYEGLDNRLKLCLLCFAIFPENAEVKERLLKFWWIGEQLMPKPEPEPEPEPEPDDEEKTSVKKTLEKFVEKGFIEAVTKTNRCRATSYKMHPIIRALIIKLAKMANFFDYDSKGNPAMDILASKKSCLVKFEGPSWFSKNVPLQPPGSEQDRKSSDSQPQTEKNQKAQEHQKDKCLAELHTLFNVSKQVQQPKRLDSQLQTEKNRKAREHERDKHLAELQTLFNVSKQFPELPEELLSKMRNIGVLYLGKWERTAERHIEVENTEFFKGLSKEYFKVLKKNMEKLHFFSLQGISGISELPKSVGKLNKLKILDLRACHNLEKLPKSIGSLNALTHLDLSECYLLDIVPKELSHLSKLRVLKGFVINKISSCKLVHLTKLGKLEKLSINVNSDDFSIDEAGGKVFSKLKALKKLKIAWGAGGEGTPPKSSTKGNKENINGVKSTRKPEKNLDGDFPLELVKLDLQCFPEKEPPSWLVPEKLTSLKRLYIKGGLLSKLCQSPDSKWPKVEFLRLKFLIDIKTSWKELRTQFRNLKYLEKVNCPRITFCPCDANGVWVAKQP